MGARIHFFSGKGGVGKSTLAAAYAVSLKNKGRRVLLIDVQGNGRALQILGLNGCPFDCTPITKYPGLFGCRILPLETFKQYFNVLLSLGETDSAWGTLTSGIRTKLIEFLFENKIFLSFAETCPGLEPAVLLGKIHWEATKGMIPDSGLPWQDIVVDAPSTGHFLMLFKSAFALTDVFSSGVVLKQARQITEYMKSPEFTKVHIVSLPEELPISEALELRKSLLELNIPIGPVLVNRLRASKTDVIASKPDPSWKTVWQDEYQVEGEVLTEERKVFVSLEELVGSNNLFGVQEDYSKDDNDRVNLLSQSLGALNL